jgi:hypothetical protein
VETLATEAELGGNLGGAFSAVAVLGDTRLFVIVSDAFWSTAVKSYDLATGAVRLVDQGDGFVHADLAIQGARLLVADRTLAAPGIRLFDAATAAELTNAPISTGLPPFSMALIE